MMAILRHLSDIGSTLNCTFVHGARTQADIIFHDECQRLAGVMPNLSYRVALSQPSASWTGLCGRLDFEMIRDAVPDLDGSRYFLCGPGEFMYALRESLVTARVRANRIQTEQFQKTGQPVVSVK